MFMSYCDCKPLQLNLVRVQTGATKYIKGKVNTQHKSDLLISSNLHDQASYMEESISLSLCIVCGVGESYF